MKKNKIILIGTNNKGKFKELSYLLPKRLKKISPSKLKIKSPKESGKSFLANSKIKANYFYLYSELLRKTTKISLEIILPKIFQ